MIRAITHPSHATFGVMVTLVRQYSEDSSPVETLHLVTAGDGVAVDGSKWEWEPHQPHAPVDPTLVLDDVIARPLLDALNRYYYGIDDARALRRDLDAERKRVDDLIAHLAAVTRNLTEVQRPGAAASVRPS